MTLLGTLAGKTAQMNEMLKHETKRQENGLLRTVKTIRMTAGANLPKNASRTTPGRHGEMHATSHSNLIE